MTEHKPFHYYLSHIQGDVPAGIVVFLVALPLCLGVALASGAPLFSGITAGMIGGIVVSWLSGSQLSVSGPAAGLTVIVVGAIQQLGSFQAFLLSVSIAGIIQYLLGVLKAGTIGAYIPSSVIKGMLAAIGIILILKQFPHAIGYDADYEGDESFSQADGRTTLSELFYSFQSVTPGAIIVSIVAIGILLIWETKLFKSNKVLSTIPGPLVVVLWGVTYHLMSQQFFPEFSLRPDQLVSLPNIEGFSGFLSQFTFPDVTQWQNINVYKVAGTIALVASLETLLSLEAVDKLDPLRRVAPTNTELKAQGIGNFLSGLVGGLPVTSVIVRSSANVNSGGRTRVACFVHGLLLLFSVLFISSYLNLIPLACLAAILIMTGYKLTHPKLFKELIQKGHNQIVPFVVTIIAVIFTDLLEGIAIGIAVGVFYVIRANFHSAISLTQDKNHYLLRLRKDVSFLNKAPLREALNQVEENGYLIVDGSGAEFIDQDIIETIEDFMASAPDDGITVELKKLDMIKAHSN